MQHMRTTINIRDELLDEAQARVHAKTKTELVERALEALIRQTAYDRLIEAGGSMPKLRVPSRRRAS